MVAFCQSVLLKTDDADDDDDDDDCIDYASFSTFDRLIGKSLFTEHLHGV